MASPTHTHTQGTILTILSMSFPNLLFFMGKNFLGPNTDLYQI
jgi:hypothetical protein